MPQQTTITSFNSRLANFGSGDVSGPVMPPTISVPEPSSVALALAGMGLMGFSISRRRPGWRSARASGRGRDGLPIGPTGNSAGQYVKGSSPPPPLPKTTFQFLHTPSARRSAAFKRMAGFALVKPGAIALVSVLAMLCATAARAQAVTTGWLNWTPPSSYPSTADTSPTSGWWGTTYPYTPTLSGSLTLPDSSVVGVTLAGEVLGVPGSTEFHTSGGPGLWNDSAAFTSANVPTLPPDGTRLALAGWGAATQTLTFSAPVSNLTLFISSLGDPGTPATWTFNQPVTILSKGTDPFTVSTNGLELTGREGRGVVQFPGTFESFSWTVSAPEMFAFYNVGVTSASIAPKPGMLAVSYWSPAAGAGGNGTWLADSNAFWAPNGDGSGSKELWGNGTAVFGGTAGTVTPSGAVLATGLSFTKTGYTLAAGTDSAIQLVGSAPAIQLSSGVSTTINTNVVASGVLAITGTGTRGTATIGGLVTATDGVQVTNANLTLSGTVQGDMALAAGTRLGGTGRINGTVSGAGTVNPGNSPGILTAAAVDPTAGTKFVLEFSGTAPNYGDASASVNDVLRLTDPTAPFTSALTSANTKTLFLNFTKAELTVGTGSILSLEGGFFTDLQTDFTSLLNNQPWNNAGFQVYVLGDGFGTDNSLNGQGYYNWRNPAMFGWEQSLFLSTVPRTADFGGDNVVAGQVMLLTVAVPEPSTYVMALAGVACGGYLVRRRRTRA
jgi:hypothetical protein